MAITATFSPTTQILTSFGDNLNNTLTVLSGSVGSVRVGTARVSGGGAANIGFATSTDSGATWTTGFLPNITAVAGGPFAAVSDASVAFDARHNVWLISSLPINANGNTGGVVTRRTSSPSRRR